MKLHWHRWRTRQGVLYYLNTAPWNGNETTRQLTGEIADVFYLPGSKRWRYDILQHGAMAPTWGVVGSPTRARRLVEEYLDRKSIAAFDDDTLEFVPA